MYHYRLHLKSPYPEEENIRYYELITAWSFREAKKMAENKYGKRLILVERWNKNLTAGHNYFEKI